MASIWPKQDAQKDDADVADTGLADVGLPPPQPLTSVPFGRPQLQRNQPQPPPPHQPPPPPAPQQIGNPNDSLSLMQLRRIVTEFPKADPTSYAFTYADTATFDEEVDEWFSYNEAEFQRLQKAKDTFERRWKKFDGKHWLGEEEEEVGWLDAEELNREEFVQEEVDGLLTPDLKRRCKSLQSILHIILGVWNHTAGLKLKENAKDEELDPKNKEKAEDASGEPKKEPKEMKKKTRATESQLEHMKAGIMLVAETGGIAILFQLMQDAFKRLW
jgi:hypothetical protein